jgi:serralysin
MPAVYSNAPAASIIDALQGAMPAALDVWNTSSQPAMVFTYKFETSQPPDQWNVFLGWTAFTAAQKAAVQSVLDEYASIINVKFVATNSPDPDINFGRVNMSSSEGGEGGYRYTYTTAPGGSPDSKTLDGYAVFNNQAATIARNTILHELGHALTLKHPGNYNADGGGAPGPYLPASQDNNKYTVMSYHADPDNGARNPHLGLYDIAALQARFGANLSYRTGNDTYTGPSGLMQAIWDAGGTDTISAAGRTAAVTINLNDGTFSSLGAKDNFAIAYGVIIENAVGGSAGDTITGNQWNNSLSGGGGDDVLRGRGGNDRLAGGAGNDTLTGGAGPDNFVFNTALNAASNIDSVKDFAHGVDVISLENAVFTALSAVGRLAASAFFAGAAAHDADDRVVYNSASGALTYDSNGSASGGAVQFAKLAAGLTLSAADFLVI